MHETAAAAAAASNSINHISNGAVDALECELDFLRHTRTDAHALLLGDDDDGDVTTARDGDDANDWPFGRADAAAAFPLPAKRPSAWTRRLVITKQPASEFYKDEGERALVWCPVGRMMDGG